MGNYISPQVVRSGQIRMGRKQEPYRLKLCGRETKGDDDGIELGRLLVSP
jgi:hypothetical protein